MINCCVFSLAPLAFIFEIETGTISNGEIIFQFLVCQIGRPDSRKCQSLQSLQRVTGPTQDWLMFILQQFTLTNIATATMENSPLLKANHL